MSGSLEKVFGNTCGRFHNVDRGVGGVWYSHHLCLGFVGQFLQRVLLCLGLGMSVPVVVTAEIPLSIQQGLFDSYRKSPLTLWGDPPSPHHISPFSPIQVAETLHPFHSGWSNPVEKFIY